MRRLAMLALMLSVASPSILASAPGGTVTLPWPEFQQLLQRLDPPPTPTPQVPPRPWGFGVGAISGTLEQGILQAKAVYELRVYTDNWVQIPLVPAAAPLVAVRLDGQPAPLAQDNGWYRLMLLGEGTHRLELELRAEAPQRPGPNLATLPLVPSAAARVTLELPTRLTEVSLEGSVHSRSPQGQLAAVLSGAGQLRLRYTLPLEGAVADAGVKLPAKVVAESETLVTLDEGLVRSDALISYQVRHSPVSSFSLGLPEGFAVASVEGAGVAAWREETGDDRRLEVQIGFEVEGAYTLRVRLERSTESSTFEVQAPLLHPLEVERTSGILAVQAQGGVEVTPINIRDVLPLDVKEIPSGLVARATNPILFGYRYIRPPEVALTVVRHETLPVLEAAVDQANLVCQVTRDGKSVTRAVYQVRNNRKQFLEVVLPDRSVLWSAYVGGQAVKPSQGTEAGERQALLVPLEKSDPSEGRLRPFEVELIYMTPVDRLRLAGLLELVTPRLDLPISIMAYTAYLPEKFDYFRIAGQLEPPVPITRRFPFVMGMSRPAPGVAADMSLAEGVPDLEELEPMARLHAGGDEEDHAFDGVDARDPLSARSRILQQEAEQMYRQEVARKVTSSSGSLPVDFRLPQVGGVHRFQSLLVIDEAPEVRLAYGTGIMGWALSILAALAGASLVVGLLGWRRDRREGKAARSWVVLAVLGLILAVGLPAALPVAVGWPVAGGLAALVWLAGLRARRWWSPA